MPAPLPHVCVVVPTHDRAYCLGGAVEAALGQSYPHRTVLVVDDGSTDDTWSVLGRFEGEPGFAAVRLGRNVGTANAKNVGLLLGPGDAVTFHDSDDLPHRDKLLVQARRLAGGAHRADPILDWASVGVEPGGPLAVDVVVHAHELVTGSGETHRMGRPLSLVDDFFPNLQVAQTVEGDWVLVNSGLFRRSVFERLGGYLDSVEEDRELRNRTIAAGCVYAYVDRVLLTKVETAVSLTTDDDTGYAGDTRRADRQAVWDRKNRWLRGGAASVEPVEVDLGDVAVEDAYGPDLLALRTEIPATSATWRALGRGVPDRTGTASAPPSLYDTAPPAP